MHVHVPPFYRENLRWYAFFLIDQKVLQGNWGYN